MPLNFPTTGLTAGVTTYTFGGNTWIWNGYAWDSVVTPESVGLTAYVRTWNGQTGNVTFSNYVTSVNGLTGVVTGIAVTGSNTFTGLQTMNAGITSNNLYVSAGATFNSNVTINGNLTVSGGITSTFSENVLIEDNFILLNSNVTGGSPSENAGIEISRGASANVQLRWNETTDNWQFTNDGTQFYDLPTSVVSSWNGSTGAVTFSNYVTSVNGSTGAVTNVAKTNTAQTFTALQDFSSGISAGSGVTFSSAYAGSFRTTTLRSDGTALQYIGDYSGVLGSGYFSVDNSSGVPVNRIAGTVYTDGIRAGGAVSVTGTISASSTITSTGRMSNAGMTATGAVAFTSSVTANNLWVTNGVTFASTSVHTGLATFNAGVTANNLYISQGATFASNISAPNVVYSFNGNSGTVTYAPPLATSSVTGVASFGNEFVVSAAGAVSLTANYVKSFNGLTGTVTYSTPLATSSVTGVASFGNEFVVSAAGAVSLTGNYVKSWNGSTGAVTFSNYVTSVNGATGVISSIAVTGSNTFTGLQTMNAGITSSTLFVSGGATFSSRTTFSGGLTTNNLFVSGGATFSGPNLVAFTTGLSAADIRVGNQILTSTINSTSISTPLAINNDAGTQTRIGDFALAGSGTYVDVDDVSPLLKLNCPLGTITIGDVGGAYNGTSIEVNDGSGSINLNGAVSANSVSSGTLTSTGDVVFGGASAFVSSQSTTLGTTAANQNIGSVEIYDGAVYTNRSVEFFVQASHSSGYEALKIMVIHDGTNTYNTQYGLIRTGASLCSSYTTTITGALTKILRLRATPTNTNTTFKVIETVIPV